MSLSERVLAVQVTDFLGSAAFSQAVQALDIKTGALVCLKIIKVALYMTSSKQWATVAFRQSKLTLLPLSAE